MINHIYPPDPDCNECKGTGTILEGSLRTGLSSFMYRKCGCGSPENIYKIQERCDHNYVCKKCEKSADLG